MNLGHQSKRASLDTSFESNCKFSVKWGLGQFLKHSKVSSVLHNIFFCEKEKEKNTHE